jgi:hypothetical protein
MFQSADGGPIWGLVRGVLAIAKPFFGELFFGELANSPVFGFPYPRCCKHLGGC